MFDFRRSGQVLGGFLETKIERDKGQRKAEKQLLKPTVISELEINPNYPSHWVGT
jgi:hypothetical protein